MARFVSSLFRILLITVVLGISSLSFAEIFPAPFKVIPQPQKVELLSGLDLEFGALKNVRIKGNFPRPIMGPILACLPSKEKPEKGTLTLKLSTDKSLPESEGGYVLLIEDSRVEIASGGEAVPQAREGLAQEPLRKEKGKILTEI